MKLRKIAFSWLDQIFIGPNCIAQRLLMYYTISMQVMRYGGLSVPDIDSLSADPVPYTTDPFPLGTDKRVIAPFWTNIGPGGSIVFATTDDTTLISKANNDINNAFSCEPDFSASVIFVANYTGVVVAGGTQVCNKSILLYKCMFTCTVRQCTVQHCLKSVSLKLLTSDE